ncbi:unnamed protein product [Phytophthora fragariaefolia]|uniref:Unnamed protein product n=1 Tax=Phytophthora fragariaefolia TaxID=1490495 RepID=A0A9W6TP37_9STRA|nr:unnamed protein product [Phytophthora fragariaefolia]
MFYLIRIQLENQIREYIYTCRRLKILPQDGKNSMGFNYALGLDPDLEELDAVSILTHHLKTDVRKAALKLKQNRIARANAGLDEALVLDGQLQQCEDQLNIENQTEKRKEAEVKRYAEQMRKEREKRDESYKRKITAAEEVEMKIANITNEDNLAEEEVTSRQHLLDVRKA